MVLGPQAPARLGTTIAINCTTTYNSVLLVIWVFSGVGPKGSVVRTRQHNVKGIDAIGGFTKEAESATTFKRGNFDHHDDVVRVRQAFSIAREAGEVRGFADEKKNT